MLKRMTEEEILHTPLTEEQKREIARLEQMPDEDIDFSDIPELDFSKAKPVRGLFYRSSIVRLDEELREYFAGLAARKKVPMNDLVNETLRKALAVIEVAK